MKLSEFDYDLPKELIAQEGLSRRDEARMMTLYPDRRENRLIKELPEFFSDGDILVINNTRVLKSRLIGKKESGGKIDCLILPSGSNGNGAVKEALIRGSKIRPGTKIYFGSGNGSEPLQATVVDQISGTRFKLEFNDATRIADYGSVPLPPYIKKKLEDTERYQTIYSEKSGSLAAPTAGLHFTDTLMRRLKSKGVEIVNVTLHIGIATFAPIRCENVEDWTMHDEFYQITEQNAQRINEGLKSKKRFFAVGTTSVRTLETAMMNSKSGAVEAGDGWTNIYIYPGYRFKFPYSGLLTNFHLPESTLLLLVSAFVGRERILAAYAEAVQKKYRFYSFGDAMLILNLPH